MKNTINNFYSVYSLLICAMLFVSAAPALFSQGNSALPAKEIFDRYIKACGGKAEFDKIKNRIVISVTEDDATKEKTEIKSIYAKPGKLYAEYKSKTLGTLLTGTDGKTAWEISSQNKPRIKEGKEKELLLRECILDKYIYHEKLFKNIKALENEHLGDKYYYKVLGTLFSGETQTLYFDMQTNYLVKVEMKFNSGGKEQPVELFLSQYKKTGNVILPYRTQTHYGGIAKYNDVVKITNNAKLPKTQFDLPGEIKKLKK